MLCRIFRPIDWYHSLVPKKFFSGVIQDLGPFLESPFLPITRKRLIFEIWFRYWAPIFFQFPIRWPFQFFGGLNFFENFPYYCNSVSPFFWIWRGQKNLCFGKKPLLIVNFTFASCGGLNDGCRNYANGGEEGCYWLLMLRGKLTVDNTY